MRCSDGDVYDGEWKDDKKCGNGMRSLSCVGTMTYNDRGKYEGEWKRDKRDGKGRCSLIYRRNVLPHWRQIRRGLDSR